MENKIRIKYTNKIYKVKPRGKKEWGAVTEELKAVEPREINFRELASIIKSGRCFILANYLEGADDIKDNTKEGKKVIESISAVGLDIDSKENPITMKEMVHKIRDDLGIAPSICYRTFNDKAENDSDGLRFRLIYKLETQVTSEEYTTIYNGLIVKYGKYLDNATSNINRIWATTDKTVFYNREYKPITEEIKEKIKSLIPPKEEVKREFVKKQAKPMIYINKEKMKEVAEIINNSIDMEDFILDHFSVNGNLERKYSERNGEMLVGCCPIHGGDNDTAFNIYKDTNTYCCFTKCEQIHGKKGGDIITVAYIAYKTNDFSSVVKEIVKEYKVNIPNEAIMMRTRGDK